MSYALTLPTRTGVGQESSQARSDSDAREARAEPFEALASTSVYGVRVNTLHHLPTRVLSDYQL